MVLNSPAEEVAHRRLYFKGRPAGEPHAIHCRVERSGASRQLDDQVGRESNGRCDPGSSLESHTFLCGAVLSAVLKDLLDSKREAEQ
jgi:hypothetical protein